ncbi:glycerol-3-phosphate ABC transporter substrate-binding protein [Pseudomonas floridensis]|uniref:sn-glycerol-3-phosphate-binding periplasmic protein UgpB n=1 Tax=Pseudomonas floridensis TaxID=1958950 RepID=A0A1X0N8L2_9PSED|nr:extracellular solute-binding protein [Pseudomonas floridensis]ORC59937.1 glycerol-3-phosphate ABC transporter substrate-binding protein [Pseudomonas floridensis]
MFWIRHIPGLLTLIFVTGHACATEFWYSHGGTTGSAIADLCRQFNVDRAQADRLHCIRQGSYEQTLQKTVAAYRAGKSPALVEIYDVATPDMLLGNATLPVETLMAERHRPYSPDTFVPTFKRYYSNEQGVLAAQPFAASTAVLYTHRDALAAAGINKPPATWTEFSETLRALKNSQHACPMATDFSPWIWLEQTSAAQGSEITVKSDGVERYRLAQGTHLHLMKDLAQWVHEGLVRHEASTRSGQQALAFASDECAMLMDSTGSWNTVYSTLRADIDVTALPIYPGTTRRANVPGGSSLWVMRGHPEQEYQVVSAFLAFALRPDNQKVFSARTGYLPVTQSTATTVQADEHAAPAIKVGLSSLDDSHGQPSAPLRCGFITLMRMIWTQETGNALAGRQSIERALSQTAMRGDELLSLFQNMHPPLARVEQGEDLR